MPTGVKSLRRRRGAKRRGLSRAGRIRLCVGLAALGSAFYFFCVAWTASEAVWAARGRRVALGVHSGGFLIAVGSGQSLSPTWGIRGDGTEQGLNLLGFCLMERVRDWNGNGITEKWWVFGLPWWVLVALPSIRGIDRYLGRRERRAKARKWQAARKRRNLCPACGYDVRASPTRCPECGRHLPPYWLRANMNNYR